LILSLKMRGAGIHYEGGFSTDSSESCVWLTPFIKPPGDRLKLMLVPDLVESFRKLKSFKALASD
jgi:hypothetical protein